MKTKNTRTISWKDMKLPDSFFTQEPLAIMELQQAYNMSYEEFRGKILNAIGFAFADKNRTNQRERQIYSTDTLYVNYLCDGTVSHADNRIPEELQTLIEPPDTNFIMQALKEAMKKAGYLTWDDIVKEIHGNPKYQRRYRYEQDELRFCLLLDMIFKILTVSAPVHILGTGKKELAVQRMREEFSFSVNFAKMIKYQLGIGNKTTFCTHRHYFSMVESMLNGYGNFGHEAGADGKKETTYSKIRKMPLEKLMCSYRFAADKELDKVRKKDHGKRFDHQIEYALVKMLLMFYCESVEMNVNPTEEMLLNYGAFAGTNSGSKRKEAKLRNKEINAEKLGLYSQMPYLYIAEWVIENRKKETDGGMESMCPLLRPHDLTSYKGLGGDSDWNSGSWKVNNLKGPSLYYKITSDFTEDAKLINNIKAFEKSGSDVSILERRITQYCFFQYVENCITHWKKLSIADSKDTENVDGFLQELFRIQYILQNSILFSGYRKDLRQKVADFYKDPKIEKLLSDIPPSLFWDTILLYMADKGKYQKLDKKDLARIIEDYKMIMEGIVETDTNRMDELLKGLCQINGKYKYYDFGIDYLSYIQKELQSLLKAHKLNEKIWDGLDSVLNSVYIDRRKSKNSDPAER